VDTAAKLWIRPEFRAGDPRVILVSLLTLAAVAGTAVLGAAAGTLIPGVMTRVPAGGPVLAAPAPRSGDLRVPATCGVLWGLLAARGLTPDLPAYLYLAWVGLALALIDVRCHRLPDALTLPSYPIALALLCAAAGVGSDGWAPARAAAGMVVLGGFYRLLAAFPAGMGGGDVKLGGLLGLYLGWAGWAHLVVGTFAAFAGASAVALGLVATRRATLRTHLPFGPFMLVGALIGLFAGGAVAGSYLG
jgi:leader peptidase (prepilin peptidase)/N-methyltransferase